MTPEDIDEARKIAGGLFAVTDSIVEHYEREAIKMYPKLIRYIDEIERENADQAEEIKRLEEDSTELVTARSYIKVLEAKKNQEGLMEACENLTKRMDKQRDALKKLGGMVRARGNALVEEGAKNICGDFGHCDHDAKHRDTARQMLISEGKIGGGDVSTYIIQSKNGKVDKFQVGKYQKYQESDLAMLSKLETDNQFMPQSPDFFRKAVEENQATLERVNRAINGSDHIREATKMVLTDEQRAALDTIIKYLEEDILFSAAEGHVIAGHLRSLRAMLEVGKP